MNLSSFHFSFSSQNNNRRLKAALSSEQKRCSHLEQRLATGILSVRLVSNEPSSLSHASTSRDSPHPTPCIPQGNARPPSSASGATTPEPQPMRAVLPHPTGWEASLLRHEPQSPHRFSRASTPTQSMPSSPSRYGPSGGAQYLQASQQHPYAASVADSEQSRAEGSNGGATFAERESHWQEQLVRCVAAHAGRDQPSPHRSLCHSFLFRPEMQREAPSSVAILSTVEGRAVMLLSRLDHTRNDLRWRRHSRTPSSPPSAPAPPTPSRC